jgi:hypothetical protein
MKSLEEDGKMRTSIAAKAALGCFMALSASAWLGCAADATDSDPVASTSQALGPVSPPGDPVLRIPPPSLTPAEQRCFSEVNEVVGTFVWALPFDPSEPGYFTKYTIQFPAIPSVISEPTVRNYEFAIWSQVTHANGFEHKISQTDPHLQVTLADPTLYYGVGINDADTPRASFPQVFDHFNVLATTADWDNEYSIAQGGSTIPTVAAVFPPLQCVHVLAYDPGEADDNTEIAAYVVMDLHDPKGPAWYAP